MELAVYSIKVLYAVQQLLYAVYSNLKTFLMNELKFKKFNQNHYQMVQNDIPSR